MRGETAARDGRGLRRAADLRVTPLAHVLEGRPATSSCGRSGKAPSRWCSFSDGAPRVPQIRRTALASQTKIAHIVHITHRDQVEAPVTDWLREAYESSDALSARARPVKAAKTRATAATKKTAAEKDRTQEKSHGQTGRDNEANRQEGVPAKAREAAGLMRRQARRPFPAHYLLTPDDRVLRDGERFGTNGRPGMCSLGQGAANCQATGLLPPSRQARIPSSHRGRARAQSSSPPGLACKMARASARWR